MKSFRAMSYNIWQGGGDDGMARCADVIQAAGADIVGLQEVWRNAAEPLKDNLGHLVRRLGWNHAFMPAHFFEGYTHGQALLNQPLSPGQKGFGEAIISRFPIESVAGRILSFLPPPEDPWKQYRGVLQARIQVGERQIEFFTCHLGASDQERRVQAREVRQYALSFPGTRIITGDFNIFPSFDYYPELTQDGFVDSWVEKGQGDGFTMAPHKAKKRIDYILYQPGQGLELKHIEVGEHGASDHKAVVADFEFV